MTRVLVSLTMFLGAACTSAVKTSVVIHATPQEVWQVLTDFSSYPEWNPFLKEVKGVAKPGATLEVTVQPPRKGRTTFKPKVMVAEPGRELRWVGKLGGVGFLFVGEHRFLIEEIGAREVRFSHTEDFAGILVPFVISEGLMHQAFRSVNEALKKRVEARGATSGAQS